MNITRAARMKTRHRLCPSVRFNSADTHRAARSLHRTATVQPTPHAPQCPASPPPTAACPTPQHATARRVTHSWCVTRSAAGVMRSWPRSSITSCRIAVYTASSGITITGRRCVCHVTPARPTPRRWHRNAVTAEAIHSSPGNLPPRPIQKFAARPRLGWVASRRAQPASRPTDRSQPATPTPVSLMRSRTADAAAPVWLAHREGFRTAPTAPGGVGGVENIPTVARKEPALKFLRASVNFGGRSQPRGWPEAA